MRNSDFGSVGAQMAGLRARGGCVHTGCARMEAARVEAACSEPFLMFFDRFSIFSTRICSG